jgi:hypothetical protein
MYRVTRRAIPAGRDPAADDEGEAESEHDKVRGTHGHASSRAISLMTIALMLLSRLRLFVIPQYGK